MKIDANAGPSTLSKGRNAITKAETASTATISAALNGPISSAPNSAVARLSMRSAGKRTKKISRSRCGQKPSPGKPPRRKP